MRQYQEDVENLNEVAHNRPRAQLVLGIQQENRHIRTLQQENKELRAALEEHQVDLTDCVCVVGCLPSPLIFRTPWSSSCPSTDSTSPGWSTVPSQTFKD